MEIIATSFDSSSRCISMEMYDLKMKIGRAKIAARALEKKNKADEKLIQDKEDLWASKASSGFEEDRKYYGRKWEDEHAKYYKLWSENQEKEKKCWDEIERLEAEYVLLEEEFNKAWARERAEREETENAAKVAQETENAVKVAQETKKTVTGNLNIDDSLRQLQRLSVNPRSI